MKILVLATARTGSTYYTRYLAEKFRCNVPKIGGEIFNVDVTDKLSNFREYLVSHRNFICKIFPADLARFYLEYGFNPLRQLTSIADQIYILYRNNMDDQIKSNYIARMSGDYQSEFSDAKDMKYVDSLYQKMKNGMLRDINDLAAIYSLLPKEKTHLVKFESFYSEEKRLRRPVKWDVEPPVFNIDVGSYFLNASEETAKARLYWW